MSWRQTGGSSGGQAADPDLDAYAGITPSSIAQQILAAADAAAERALFGLGTAAVQNVGDFCQVANNLSDVTAATARTNLGLGIGTNVQAYDADLAAIAGLTSAADKGIMFTGAGTAAVFTLTAAALTVLDDTTVAAMCNTLGAKKHVDALFVATDGATITLAVSDGHRQKVTLAGNRTLTGLTSLSDGETLELWVFQDGTGSRTLTYTQTIRWAGGSAPTLTTTASKADVLIFKKEGSEYFGFMGGQNL